MPESGYLDDRQLVDNVRYLASLTSETTAVDPVMDTLRTITARWDGTTALDEKDRALLQKLRLDLKTYLVTKDPLRDFNLDSLERRLHARATGSDLPSTRSWLDFQTVVLLSLTFAAASILVPTTPSIAERVALAIPFFLLLITAGCTWFYLSSLNNFKEGLRKVFVYLCVGSIGMGVQFLYFVIVPLIGVERAPLYKYGGFTLIATTSVAFMYAGLRRYAALLNLSSRFSSRGLLALILMVTTATAYTIPFLLHEPKPIYFGFSLMSMFATVSVALMAAGLTRTIIKHVTSAYSSSLSWLWAFMVTVGLGVLGYSVAVVLLGELTGITLNAALAASAAPAILILLYSGYSFKKATSS